MDTVMQVLQNDHSDMETVRFALEVLVGVLRTSEDDGRTHGGMDAFVWGAVNGFMCVWLCMDSCAWLGLQLCV